MKKLWNSRVGQYLFFGIFYLSILKMVGFEITVTICLSTIIGEMTFKTMNNKP